MISILTYILILLGVFTYIFIAGLVLVSIRMEYYALVQEKNYTYELMSTSSDENKTEHVIALIWPFLLFFAFTFYVAGVIYGRFKKLL